jgi:peptide/nickel transport system permease protein
MIPLLALVSILAFALLFLVPGDPAVTLAGENPAPGQVEQIREDLGLDRPVITQYLTWAGNATTGDLGDSLYTSLPVSQLIVDRIPATLSLALCATLVAIVIGMIAGLIAAATKGSIVDRAITLLASLGTAIPPFWLGLMLIIGFALDRTWFPAVGYVEITENPVLWAKHLVLPALTLGAAPAAEIARQLRGSLGDTLDMEYIRTARAKGVRRAPVVLKHGLKNAGIPVVTVIGVQFSLLLGGSVIVEQIFGIPGIGNLAISSVLSRDVPVIQGIVLVAAVAVLVCNLLVDISYGYFNPKVRAA